MAKNKLDSYTDETDDSVKETEVYGAEDADEEESTDKNGRKAYRTPAEKAELQARRKARKAEKAELKKKHIAEEERSKKSIFRFFRECISECKKVVWSPKKEVFSNTVIVLTTLVIAAAFIFGVDSALGALFGLMYK